LFVADHHTLEQLQGLTRAPTQQRIWRRAQAVVLAKQGRTATDIADALGCSLKAVTNWVAQYNRGGIEALREQPRPGRPRSLAPEHYPRLKQRLDTPPGLEDGTCALRAADVRRILEREFGVTMGRQAVYDLLHRLGYSDLMPRPHHEEANPEVQEFFKEIVVEQIDAIAADHPADQVRVYFQDEARFGTQGTIARVWAPRGSRPRAVRQNGREWLYVLMAVCAGTGAASALIMPELNTAVVNQFLEQLSRDLSGGEHAVVIWDGAGFHSGKDLVVPGNVSLIRLPPYSVRLQVCLVGEVEVLFRYALSGL
jgi:transposase